MDSLRLAQPEEDSELEGKIVEETRRSLHSFLGRQEGEKVWREACLSCTLNGRAPSSFEALEQVAERLKGQQGPVALVGHSLSIQVRTYQLLARSGRLNHFLKGGTL